MISPIMPFLADHLWRNLVSDVCEGAPDSVFLAAWPEEAAELADESRLPRSPRCDACRARTAGSRHAGIKLRQPLRQAVVYGAGVAAHAAEIADELRVKEVRFESGAGPGALEAEPAGAPGRRLGRSSPPFAPRSRRAGTSCGTAWCSSRTSPSARTR